MSIRDAAGRQNLTEPQLKANRHILTREQKRKGGRSGSRILAKRAPQRTERGRRIRALFAGFMEGMEAGNTIHEAAALRAAELWTSAEEWREKLARGEKVAEDVVRIENAARRAERDLKALAPESVGWQPDDQGDDEAEPEATPEPAADEFDPIKIMLRRKAAEKAAAGKPPEQTP